MSGLSRTPGKRVWVNSPPRVRIPPAPPKNQALACECKGFFHARYRLHLYRPTAKPVLNFSARPRTFSTPTHHLN